MIILFPVLFRGKKQTFPVLFHIPDSIDFFDPKRRINSGCFPFHLRHRAAASTLFIESLRNHVAFSLSVCIFPLPSVFWSLHFCFSFSTCLSRDFLTSYENIMIFFECSSFFSFSLFCKASILFFSCILLPASDFMHHFYGKSKICPHVQVVVKYILQATSVLFPFFPHFLPIIYA